MGIPHIPYAAIDRSREEVILKHMFIHFAFGSIGSEGRYSDQIDKAITKILTPRTLMTRYNTEFLPELPRAGSWRIPVERFKAVGRTVQPGTIEDSRIVGIRYLPVKIPMLCFIRTSLKKLPGLSHVYEYGRLGFVLNDDFLRRKGLHQVNYYTEDDLWKDRLIREWNRRKDAREECANIEKAILSFRKPAECYREFHDPIGRVEVTGPDAVEIRLVNRYSRYPVGYDFTQEHEFRIVTEEEEYIEFDETDLFMLIVPTEDVKQKVQTYFDNNWKQAPKIMVYPS